MTHALIALHDGWTLTSHDPPAAGAHGVRVKVMIAGLCRTDIQAMTGQRPTTQGRILGHEAAGVIEYIPSALAGAMTARGLSQGDRVAFFPFLPCQRCPDCLSGSGLGYCTHAAAVGLEVDGAFASSIDLPPGVLVKAPDGLSWKHLAYAEPVAAAMGVWNCQAVHGARDIAVIGRGRIAELTRRVLLLRHANVSLVDPDEDPQHDAFDVVVETWPTEAAMEKAARMLHAGGTLIIKSRPARSVPWPHQVLTLRRIKCEGAPYGSFQRGLEAMAGGALKIDDMLGASYPFTQAGVEQALTDEHAGGEGQGKLFFEIHPCAD